VSDNGAVAAPEVAQDSSVDPRDTLSILLLVIGLALLGVGIAFTLGWAWSLVVLGAVLVALGALLGYTPTRETG